MRSPIPPKAHRESAKILILFALLCLAPPAHPQGCNECRETIGQTPARTQTAYRSAILLMVFSSAGIFTAAVLLFRRYR